MPENRKCTTWQLFWPPWHVPCMEVGTRGVHLQRRATLCPVQLSWRWSLRATCWRDASVLVRLTGSPLRLDKYRAKPYILQQSHRRSGKSTVTGFTKTDMKSFAATTKTSRPYEMATLFGKQLILAFAQMRHLVTSGSATLVVRCSHDRRLSSQISEYCFDNNNRPKERGDGGDLVGARLSPSPLVGGYRPSLLFGGAASYFLVGWWCLGCRFPPVGGAPSTPPFGRCCCVRPAPLGWCCLPPSSLAWSCCLSLSLAVQKKTSSRHLNKF